LVYPTSSHAYLRDCRNTEEIGVKGVILPLARVRKLSGRDLRRLAIALAALSAAGVWAPARPALAEQGGNRAIEVPVEELMKPSPLRELVLGSNDAPITVVEYLSMTCSHCADFHNGVLPKLKEKYVDTGKVKFVMREFPLDDRGVAAAMLVRCASDDKALSLIATLFAKQAQWAFRPGNARAHLSEIAQQAGFTQKSLDACLADQKLLDKVSAVRDRAAKTFNVKSTPAFFINGKRFNAKPTIEEFGKAFEAQ
jgi:protein-disulfide isomerase